MQSFQMYVTNENIACVIVCKIVEKYVMSIVLMENTHPRHIRKTHRLSVLLQLHLHSRLNIWLEWIV